ncbi:bifunctional demethylmenaquinone methyltransferase/2-methoxy-6-polyprenyl-1,4-benzoquinol methylase UbiE [Campylobacter geochelonis]|uniref:Demethylmenaquinone methyltransferase n=1 Tax=Campylobacter geochelonis TaxID=1780362 RepID=A0A128ECQ1_9BACT|nr:bifunctional demethylmenaquinone methyltransferase/2-methoxy-6-polyprenyl-1,4-benzoquinol methylase UbiE [Campylobacter geochelonis]QKF70632.1 bifunctional 2-octaprenyl-6-methoxy-1,4-benzoquinone methylase / S-adenosylmethionine:2-DMK methyltransferase [Campylobacter geochelonis]CZE45894.1 ubiquinone/menaquinone biosynthesis methyltransferase [Campylobacter geochelonis]CZE46745.1 ubiquinone/menaquinone biosynthesis methyltransferase [Campylobacter geochelonis]CZE50325.1 ubiquinone/menaquinon
MQKQEKIVEMFNAIAPTYDKANRAISLGLDTSWRKTACQVILSKFINREASIADVACGTGDMLGLWHDMAKGFNVKLNRLVGIDPSSGMLNEAKKKFANLEFIEASAENTTLENESVDVLSISYGIRNVVERVKALEEFNRVVKMGGYVVVLEFTKTPKKGIVTYFRDLYVSKVLPKIGEMISKNKEAYEYLPSSIGNFLDTQSFIKELEKCGFEMEVVKGFSFDVSTMFIAKKVRNL